MKIALVIPTRGILFADTVVSFLRELQVFDDQYIFIISGLPMPESHNECVRQALRTDCSHILFLEEDVVIPSGGLAKMATLAMNGADVVHMEYNLEGGTSVMHIKGELMWCGVGCTLFHRSIFERIGEPYFRNDKTLSYQGDQLVELDQVNKYGGHDVLLGLQLRKMGVPIVVVPNMQAKHLRMSSWERKTINDGAHNIYSL